MAVSDPLLVGIDLGAGSLKISIIKGDGSLVSEASAPVATSSPHPGWSEQNPDDWWLAACDALLRGLKASRRPASDIAAISFSAGAHTQVLEHTFPKWHAV